MEKINNNVNLVVVGSNGIDNIETPFDKKIDQMGGSVSYACSASSFFAKTGMVGIVGYDFPDEFIALYKRFSIDIDGLQKVPGKTFRWSGVYEVDMINRRTISTELNVFADFMPELPEHYKNAPYLLLGNISPDLQLHVLDQIKEPKLILADTMDLWINNDYESLMKVIARVDILTLNDSEIRLLTSENNLLKAAKIILNKGPRFVIVKKGEHGAMMVSNNGIFLVPAYPIENVVDPTGAGDSFAGGLMGSIAELDSFSDKDIKESLLIASVTASFTCEDFSLNKLSSISKYDILNRLSDLKKMMTI